LELKVLFYIIKVLVKEQNYRFLINRPVEFVRPPGTAHLDCAQILKNDVLSMEYAQQRIVYKDPPWPDDLLTDCQSIFQRNYFQLDGIYREEERFPLAFVRVVYKVQLVD
jgi:16S rRNA G966 N2-methylase RsmD